MAFWLGRDGNSHAVKQDTNNREGEHKVKAMPGTLTLKWPRSSHDDEPWRMCAELPKTRP